MSQPYTTPIAEADLSFAAEKTAQSIRVFIAGPLIKKEWTAEDWGQARASSRLRRRLMEFVEQQRHEVLLGEHRGVKEMADASIPTTPSAVVTETFIAARTCHCIIMIPDSPGSFCELGAWAHHKDVASKMLILANRQFENETSYVNPSVFALATTYGARLQWVPYDDPEMSLDVVGRFVAEHQERAFISRVMHGH